MRQLEKASYAVFWLIIDSNIRSGSAADTQAISDAVRFNLEMHVYVLQPNTSFSILIIYCFNSCFSSELNDEPDVKTAATLFHNIVYSNKDRLSAGIICGGYDRHEGGSIYRYQIV